MFRKPITYIMLSLLGLILVSCSEDALDREPQLRPVRFQPVYATGGTRVRTFSGTAQAGIESEMSFRVAGTIQRKHVKVGDNVRAGALIAELDPSDYELQVQQAEAALSQAEAERRRAEANYERVRAMWENRNASRSDLDAARAADESARAAVQSLEKQLELARRQLAYTRLTAAVAGSIAQVMIDVNENVKAGQVVALLTSGSRLKVQLTVPEILIAQVREGDEAIVTFDALPDKKLSARVTEVGVSSAGAMTTFPLAVMLDRDDPDVRPGMAAEVALTFTSTDDRERFLVPPVAVGQDRTGRFVYVVKSAEPGVGVIERREVTVGELTADGLEVFDGLFEGDFLVTAGVSKIEDGMKVRFDAAGERP